MKKIILLLLITLQIGANAQQREHKYKVKNAGIYYGFAGASLFVNGVASWMQSQSKMPTDPKFYNEWAKQQESFTNIKTASTALAGLLVIFGSAELLFSQTEKKAIKLETNGANVSLKFTF